MAKQNKSRRVIRRRSRSNRQLQGAMAPSGIVASQPNSSIKFSSKGSAVFIERSELVSSLAGSVADSVSSFPVNPGLNYVFPWLFPIANRFELYRFKFLRFRYQPTSPSTATGSVALCFDHDANDDYPVNARDFADMQDHVFGSTWSPIGINVNVNQLNMALPYRYTRPYDLIDTDNKTMDSGSFHVLVSGQASTATIGNIWVDYRVELSVPQVEDGIPGEYIDHTADLSVTSPWGATQPTGVGEEIATVEANASGYFNTLKFKKVGEYLLDFICGGTNVTALNLVNGNGVANTVLATLINGAGTALTKTVKVNVTVPNGTLETNPAADTWTQFNGYISPHDYTY